ncbi:hypothetical protein TELCIR_05135 [Teladorsagia circumcincta]|uniref:Probable imidazolonepropionase n=1 Tax=Teladorsagia circumcincta TaxID=45464 RepID=A0A2G9UTR3_TELCI|nr:hypothetical protein TELCIR_05135 [Teladorsagia circumcincta]
MFLSVFTDLQWGGVIVALGSDFNPNAYCLAMPMIMHLACVYMHMSMEEALVAATLNAAHSLGRGRTHGAICVGRQADFVVLDESVSSWKHIIYSFATRVTIAAKCIKAQLSLTIASYRNKIRHKFIYS